MFLQTVSYVVWIAYVMHVMYEMCVSYIKVCMYVYNVCNVMCVICRVSNVPDPAAAVRRRAIAATAMRQRRGVRATILQKHWFTRNRQRRPKLRDGVGGSRRLSRSFEIRT